MYGLVAIVGVAFFQCLLRLLWGQPVPLAEGAVR